MKPKKSKIARTNRMWAPTILESSFVGSVCFLPSSFPADSVLSRPLTVSCLLSIPPSLVNSCLAIFIVTLFLKADSVGVDLKDGEGSLTSSGSSGSAKMFMVSWKKKKTIKTIKFAPLILNHKSQGYWLARSACPKMYCHFCPMREVLNQQNCSSLKSRDFFFVRNSSNFGSTNANHFWKMVSAISLVLFCLVKFYHTQRFFWTPTTEPKLS